ncbi:MAG: hypothetical protein ABIH76_02075 [Candidatus Bathyarchaeota archaeon]
MARPNFWQGLETTGYPFEIKVAEALERAKWKFIIDYPCAVTPSYANLPVEETAIDFKAWQGSLFALIEARRAANCEWTFFRKARSESFFILSHHNESQRRTNHEFHLRMNTRKDVSWTHSQSVIRFQSHRGIYSNSISVNSRGNSKDGKEDQRANNSEIRKGAKQASIATIGIINDDYAFMRDATSVSHSPGTGRLYFPVIVTAGKISVLDISSNQIDKDGKLPDWESINRKEEPWVIYRYSLPRSLWLPIFFPQNIIDNHELLDKHRKLDICVVNIMHLEKFLAEMKDIVE